MLDRKFQFTNFVPSSSTHRYCSRKFGQLWMQAPLDSDVSATIVRSGDQKYVTRIVVSAPTKTFEIEATDSTVLVSIGIATDQIKSALSEWRRERLS